MAGFAVSACGSPPSEAGPTPTTPTTPTSGATAENDPDGGEVGASADRDTDGDREDEPSSTLGAYLGYRVPVLDGTDDAEIRRIYEETIAACMQEQGFTYVPWVPEPDAVILPVEEGLDHESREFAAKYGYGVSTQYYAQRDVGLGLLGYTGDRSRINLDADPNIAIQTSLSPEESLAFQKAFLGADNPYFGDPEDYDEEAEGVPLGWAINTHGCVGEAERAMDGEAFDMMGLFAREILEMPEQARADQRYLDYVASVERCVSDAGFDFYALEPGWAVLAHFDDLTSEVDQLVGGDPFAGLDEEAMAQLSQEDWDQLYNAPRDLSPAANDRLAEVQDLETATATAAWDCGGSAGEQRRVLRGILDEYESEFIESNRDELERFRR